MDAVSRVVRLPPDRFLHDRARMSFRTYARLLDKASGHVGDPCLGLRMGTSGTAHPHLLEYGTLRAERVGDALARLGRLLGVLIEGFVVSTERENDHAAVSVRTKEADPELLRHAVECAMGIVVSHVRALAGTDLAPRFVELRHRDEGHFAEHERLFGGPVRFDRDRNALVYGSEVMEIPVAIAAEELPRLLERYLHEALGEPEIRDLSYDVRRTAAMLLPSGEPTLELVARRLNTSSRTLARRLNERGVAYRQLLEDTRCRLALRYLADRRFGLSHVTFLLGYSELAAFNRAFRRWTGTTPQRYRSATMTEPCTPTDPSADRD